MSDLNVYTTSQINALTPITGDMVVDSDLNAVKLYDGSAWRTWNFNVTAGFNIDVRDTRANIVARSGDSVGTIALVTSGANQYDLMVYDGVNWQIYFNS